MAKDQLQKLKRFQNNPDMAKHEETISIADSLEMIAENLASPVEAQDGHTLIVKGKKGDKGEKGDKGDAPTEKELIEIIKPLIPDPIKGDKGDSIKGDKGDSPTRAELKEIIEPLIPAPRQGEKGDKGEDAKLDPEKIRDMIESLVKKLSIQAIEDLPRLLEEMSKEIERIGGGGGFTSPIFDFVDDETPRAVGASTTIYTIHYIPVAGSLKLYRGGARQRLTEDYTLSEHGKKITWIIPVAVGEILLADYRKS